MINRKEIIHTYKICIVFTFLFSLLLANKSLAQTANIQTYLPGTIVTDIKNDGVNIWVATEGNGIYFYNKQKDKWINYSSENNKIKQDFFYSIEVGNRYVWAGSADGLYIFDKKRNRWNRRKFGLGGQFGNWIRSLKFDSKRNVLWIGRFRYLSNYNLITKKYSDIDLTVNKDDKSNSVKSLNIDGDSILWIGVESGVHKMNLNTPNAKTIFLNNRTNYFLSEGRQVSVSKVITELDNIWFATDEFVTEDNPDFNVGGLYRFDRKINWQKFDTSNLLKGNGIFTIEQTGNYIWVSNYEFDSDSKIPKGKGIVIINRKNFNAIVVEHDLIPDTILSLHFDGKNLWLGTNDGLRKLTLLNDFVADFN